MKVEMDRTHVKKDKQYKEEGSEFDSCGFQTLLLRDQP